MVLNHGAQGSLNGARPHPPTSPRTFFWVSTPAPHLSSDVKYLDVQIGQFSCPLFEVTGSPVYSCKKLFDIFRESRDNLVESYVDSFKNGLICQSYLFQVRSPPPVNKCLQNICCPVYVHKIHRYTFHVTCAASL